MLEEGERKEGVMKGVMEYEVMEEGVMKDEMIEEVMEEVVMEDRVMEGVMEETARLIGELSRKTEVVMTVEGK